MIFEKNNKNNFRWNVCICSDVCVEMERWEYDKWNKAQDFQFTGKIFKLPCK